MARRGGRMALRGLLPGLLLAGLTVYFLFRPTGEHAPLLDGISPGAEWISFHDAPGERFDDVMGSDPVRAVLGMLGAEADEDTRFWIRELFPREVVLARERGMGDGFTPGWVLISRISGRQTRQRVLLDLVGLEGYVRVGKHHGNVLWTYAEEGEVPLTVTLANGKLVFVKHEDPQAIREVLDRLDGRRHRFAAFRTLPEELLPAADAADRGFWLGNGAVPEAVGVVTALSDPQVLGLRAGGAGVAGWLEGLDGELHERAARFGGPSAAAMGRWPAGWGAGGGAGQVLLLGGAFRTPLAILNVPTPVLLQRAGSEAEAMRLADGWMGELGRMTGMGWTGVDTPQGRRYFPEDRMLRRVMTAEKVPVARWDGEALRLGLSEATMRDLEARAGQPAADYELESVRWRGEEMLVWVSGAKLAEALGPVAQVLGMVMPGDAEAVERAGAVLAGLPGLELRGFREGEGVRLELGARLQE